MDREGVGLVNLRWGVRDADDQLTFGGDQC